MGEAPTTIADPDGIILFKEEMRKLITALNAFFVIINGHEHIFQSDKYTSIKGNTIGFGELKYRLRNLNNPNSTYGYWLNREIDRADTPVKRTEKIETVTTPTI